MIAGLSIEEICSRSLQSRKHVQNLWDRAYGEIGMYDRMSICVPPKPVVTWKSGLIMRVVLWGGLPVAGLIIWGLSRFFTA